MADWDRVLVELRGLRDQVGRVIAAVESATSSGPTAEAWWTTEQAAESLGMSRDALDELRARVPADLPGAPCKAGTGEQRNHWRWPAHELHDWRQAAEDHLRRPKRRPKRRPRSSKPPAPPTSGPPSLLAQVLEDVD